MFNDYKEWDFEPCISPSEGRLKASNWIKDNKCNAVILGVVGSTYGFWYR